MAWNRLRPMAWNRLRPMAWNRLRCLPPNGLEPVTNEYHFLSDHFGIATTFELEWPDT
jgi:hypothetical protein